MDRALEGVPADAAQQKDPAALLKSLRDGITLTNKTLGKVRPYRPLLAAAASQRGISRLMHHAQHSPAARVAAFAERLRSKHLKQVCLGKQATCDSRGQLSPAILWM